MTGTMIIKLKDHYPIENGTLFRKYREANMYPVSNFVRCVVIPQLTKGRVILGLSGYNRYTRSFLKEITDSILFFSKYNNEMTRNMVSFNHDHLESLELMCSDLLKEGL